MLGLFLKKKVVKKPVTRFDQFATTFFFFYIYNIFFISTTYTQYRVKSYKQTKKWIKHIHKQQLSYTNNNYHTQTTIITHKQQLSHTNKQKSCFTIQQMLHVFLYESNSDQFFNIVINKVPNFQY